MQPLNILIVDDEQHCVDTLQSMLQRKFPELPPANGRNSVSAARRFMEEETPDLVFLDIEMPHQNGFELFHKLERISFDVIFTTAYEHYALKAIKFNALDYLLKPFSISELEAAVRKFIHKKQTHEVNPSLEAFLYNLRALNQTNKKIALPAINGLTFVPVHTIIRCESLGNYTRIHFTGKTNLLVSKSLKDFEFLLEDMDFFRVHHSHLINMQQIRSYIQGEGGYAVMSDGSHVEISRRRKAEFLKKAAQF